ncbi:MAG: hypothetical protein OXG26_18425 [Caldilineaceae bacterium]|nr:hypothetical protein [Caldilineaceae bacterium]
MIAGLQVHNWGAAKQRAEQMVESLFMGETPGRGSHPQYASGPLSHSPRPAVRGGMVRLVNDHEIIASVLAPHIHSCGAAAYGLGHQDGDAVPSGRRVVTGRPARIDLRRDVCLDQLFPSLRDQLFAMGQPDGFAAPLEPFFQQSARDDSLAAAGGELHHHAGLLFCECGLDTV